MPHPLEYHIPVRPLIPASLALLGMLLLAPISPAQTNGAASSGFGHAVSASATSPSHSAHTSTNSGGTSSARTPRPANSFPNNAHSHRNPGSFFFPYVYPFPIPYSADVLDNGASDDNDPNYQGGPTVFDRRGAGPYSYIPPGSESPLDPKPEAAQAALQNDDASTADSDPEPPIDPTILVFRDGHQLEVDNYAIVNQTLYDLTPGHPRKIALADLDLPATQKQNDDRGITFELPSSAQAN
ncbi:MAG TPA: hypothetical protein VK706_00940 [Candidatus Sulfotelmatobacter sp.]|jgi:hypothetical protein|nr:hypothetical protein [Candidatus Sulfotelmatobacter sp.]